MVTHERLTEPRLTLAGLLARPRSISNLHVFLDPNGIINIICEHNFAICIVNNNLILGFER